MSEHTKGPWIVGTPDIRCVKVHEGRRGHPGGSECAYEFQGWLHGEYFDRYVSSEFTKEAIVSPDEYGDGPTPADCALIAAAPDLLEMLKAIQFGWNGRCPVCAGWNCGSDGETDGVHTTACGVAAAIAKAEGK